jgi:hypothetical protein
MKAATSTFDSSILPEHARQELHDFYRFLVGKYANRLTRPKMQVASSLGTARALAASPIVGIWKDRDMGDSSDFARSLREQAQKRTTV